MTAANFKSGLDRYQGKDVILTFGAVSAAKFDSVTRLPDM